MACAFLFGSFRSGGGQFDFTTVQFNSIQFHSLRDRKQRNAIRTDEVLDYNGSTGAVIVDGWLGGQLDATLIESRDDHSVRQPQGMRRLFLFFFFFCDLVRFVHVQADIICFFNR